MGMTMYQPHLEKVVIDAPRHPVVRSRFLDERHVAVDFRGIRLPMRRDVSHKKGNRPLWCSVEQLNELCNKYFDSCFGPVFDKNYQVVMDSNGQPLRTQTKPFTMAGLARALRIDTVSLLRYKRGEIDVILDDMRADTDDAVTFGKILWEAKQKIEEYAESRLYDRDGFGGARHVLSCGYGAKWVPYKEKAEIEKMFGELDIKKEEFLLKKKLLEDGGDDDSITINVVRASKKGEE